MTTITEGILKRYQNDKDTLTQTSAILNNHRAQAYDLLAEKGVPKSRTEDYKRFDIDKVLSDTWHFSYESSRECFLQSSAHTCSLPHLHSRPYTMYDDRLYEGSDTSEAFFLGSMVQFAERYPLLADRYYNSMPSVQADPMSALNTLFVQEVCVIYIPKGVEVKAPIQITGLSSPIGRSFSMPRFLVILEENARATLLFCDHTGAQTASLQNRVIEIYAEQYASLELYDIEESGIMTTRVSSLHVQQKAHSTVLIDNLSIQNGCTRNNFFADMVGERASFDLDGMCILDGDQRSDNYSYIRHSVPNCHSNELFKYTLDDRAVGSFSGRIYVARDAQKTQAYQNNRNLSLSPTAKMYSKPQLEIYADDVKCSHGMTTGQLDETALFYMKQRGIPTMEAKLLLTIAFMADVLDTIQLKPLRDRLHDVVEKRFRGLPAGCKGSCE